MLAPRPDVLELKHILDCGAAAGWTGRAVLLVTARSGALARTRTGGALNTVSRTFDGFFWRTTGTQRPLTSRSSSSHDGRVTRR